MECASADGKTNRQEHFLRLDYCMFTINICLYISVLLEGDIYRYSFIHSLDCGVCSSMSGTSSLGEIGTLSAFYSNGTSRLFTLLLELNHSRCSYNNYEQ